MGSAETLIPCSYANYKAELGFALKLVYELVYLNFHSMLIIFSTFLFCIGSFSAFMTQLHFALYVHGLLCFGVL